MDIKNIERRVIAEINLNALEENFKKITGPVCCVVKADAYGHGAVEVSKFLEKLGASYLAVSNIEEAIEIRNGGVKMPIVILGYTPTDCAKELATYDIDQCVYSFAVKQCMDHDALRRRVLGQHSRACRQKPACARNPAPRSEADRLRGAEG